VKVDVGLALLSPDDFRAAFPGPYGMPFVAGRQIAVLPADLTQGVVVDTYRRLEATASPEVLERLRREGLSFDAAVRLMADLVGLHEVGHVQTEALGIDPRQAWFVNRLYTGVGGPNYVWFQDSFQLQVRNVFDTHGLGFLRSVRDRFADPDWKPERASELITALEAIAPGFVAWSRALSGSG
jgi:hypothetical protein